LLCRSLSFCSWGFSSQIAGAQKGFVFGLPAGKVYFFEVLFEVVPDTPKNKFAACTENGQAEEVK
jgi:hypothetical protein